MYTIDQSPIVSSGLIFLKPSIADVTDIGGVIIPSASRAAPPDHSRKHRPLAMPPYESKQGKDTTFSFVICSQGEHYILHGGLQSKGPNDARQCAYDQVLFDQLAVANGVHNVQGRCSYIPVNNTQRNDESGERCFIQILMSHKVSCFSFERLQSYA